jgi:hypothetical protein
MEKIFKAALPGPFPPARSSTLRLLLDQADDRTLEAPPSQSMKGGIEVWDLKSSTLLLQIASVDRGLRMLTPRLALCFRPIL